MIVGQESFKLMDLFSLQLPRSELVVVQVARLHSRVFSGIKGVKAGVKGDVPWLCGNYVLVRW